MSVRVPSLTSSLAGTPVGLRVAQAMAEEIPGAATALDPEHMQMRLQAALLGAGSDRTIVSCRPGQATYLPGDRLLVRYRLETSDGPADLSDVAYVNAQVFETAHASESHFRRLIEPLAARARSHAALKIFARPAAVLEDLGMTLAAFPIDAALPTLVDATDEQVVVPLLSGALRRGVKRCDVHLGHYGRQHRCVLRYEVETSAAAHAVERMTVWGKVASDERGSTALAALEALQDNARRRGFLVPRPLGYASGLRLLLLADMGGIPQIGPLLKARIQGRTKDLGPSLEASVRATANLLVGLHESAFTGGARRDSRSEVEALARWSAQVGRLAPALGSSLERALEGARVRLEASSPLKATLAHGDFSHTQIVFDGTQPGVVDFDTVCRAEPALDIGHFVAHLRLAALKAADPPRGRALGDELRELFVRAYTSEATESSEHHLRKRAAIYETLSLVRLAVHSWQKLKTARLDRVMTLLEE